MSLSCGYCRAAMGFALIGASFAGTSPLYAQSTTSGTFIEKPVRHRPRPAAAAFQGGQLRFVPQYEITDQALLEKQQAEDALFVARLQDQGDELLGATLQPVGDTLRAQLDIPAGQGLLVVNVRAEGPSAQAGLQANDILLTLADKHLASAEDLTSQLKSAGESAVPLKLLRTGKPLTIQVRPIYRVTLGPVAQQKAEYYIGVSISGVEGPLRAQLGLPAGQGVVVDEVVGSSPAEKSGVKKHDIILELGGKAIDNPETLAREVQAAMDRPTTLKLLRGGKPLMLPVTGAVRKVEVNQPEMRTVRLWLANGILNTTSVQANAAGRASTITTAEDVAGRLDRLEQELKALRAALDRLNETIKADKR